MHKQRLRKKRVPFESGQKNVDKEEELQYSSPHRKPMNNESKAKSSLGRAYQHKALSGKHLRLSGAWWEDLKQLLNIPLYI